MFYILKYDCTVESLFNRRNLSSTNGSIFILLFPWIQIWRAIRLVVDTGLHAKGLTRDKALEMFAKYAWDTSDVAQKEVTRYQSGPGQATSYMIGQLVIQKSREEAKKRLGQKFDLKEFHYQVRFLITFY